MKTDFKTIFFYFIQVCCSVALFFFTIITTAGYTKRLVEGYSISAFVTLFYIFILYRSHLFFKNGRLGLAYFLTIALFLVLAFIQMIGCSNSLNFVMH